MKVTPDDYGRRCQFDHFCKLVLYHKAVDYFRERKRQRGWETSFETLPLSELDTLCTIDQYPSDSFIELLPLSVIEAARAGDAEAVERVLRYYSSYMNKLCTRTLYDENGYPHVCLDEAMKRRLEIKLIHAIVTTK